MDMESIVAAKDLPSEKQSKLRSLFLNDYNVTTEGPNNKVVNPGVEKFNRIRKMFKKHAERCKADPNFDPPIYKEDVEKAGKEQTKKLVPMALEHYNATTGGPKYELVEAIGSNGIVSVELHPFTHREKLIVVNAWKYTIDGCGSCPPHLKMYHTKDGFEVCNRPYKNTEEPIGDTYHDAYVPMERRAKFAR
ncbi:hypothetical protein OROMI_005779 [Orobanche minor]